jgi:nucleotidyltransferase substrate binding protein (TIGR01987 family)
MTEEKPRWLYRFDNYSRALALLADAVAEMSKRSLSPLEMQGTVQCFEVTLELAWKVLKDYLENSGIVLESATPKNVIRAAFQANLVADGETWMDALEARNRMSHTYDAKGFEKIVADIARRFYPLLDALFLTLKKQPNA